MSDDSRPPKMVPIRMVGTDGTPWLVFVRADDPEEIARAQAEAERLERWRAEHGKSE